MSRLFRFKRFLREHRDIHRMSKGIAILYGILYYIAAGFIQIRSVDSYKQLFVNEIVTTATKMRGPLLWLSVAEFQMPPFLILRLSPLNLLVMFMVMWFVYYNVGFLVVSSRFPRICQLVRNKGRIGAMFPLLLTGIGCIAPMIIMVIGLADTLASSLLLVFAWLIPISLFMLVVGIIQGLIDLHLHY